MLKLKFNSQIIYCCTDMRDYKSFILQLTSVDGEWTLYTPQQFFIYEQQLRAHAGITDKLFKVLCYGSSIELQRKRHYLSLSAFYRSIELSISTIYYQPSRFTI